MADIRTYRDHHTWRGDEDAHRAETCPGDMGDDDREGRGFREL